MEDIQYSIPSNMKQVFADFKGRRAGLIKALTTDSDNFYQQCNPERENLCLYGHQNESWEVNLPIEEVPAVIPEPVLGINFARDGMKKNEWLSLIAIHSDSWLISVASYHGTRLGFGKTERAKLYDMISDLPTVHEVLTESFERPKEKISAQQKDSKKRSRNKSSQEPEPLGKVVSGHVDEENVDEDDDDETAICGTCGSNSTAVDGFWIFCDSCERWFHGKCVKITPAKAKHIKEYKCPDC